ncbi:MAG: tRNA (N6-isopentenyl adenosine(37)-C2)-methylthiotransferase MiaB, partial [Anaerolineae bacterium]|nr:tRNA (N6-isopentenyl adenosine(37)-C2)-methylthiotransferase MiaB [Anaerolineae bacterium]
MKYHIWTLGCQMNVADSQRLASELERLGHHAAADADQADILVVNTCVVRQSAEDKGLNRLMALRGVKEQNPEKVIGVMGCMVGVRDPLDLRKRLPFVDVFMPPSEPGPMVNFLAGVDVEAEALEHEAAAREQRDALQNGDLILPV